MEKNRLVLYLDGSLTQALMIMSRDDCRTPTQETAWILREEAMRRGLLTISNWHGNTIFTHEVQSKGVQHNE